MNEDPGQANLNPAGDGEPQGELETNMEKRVEQWAETLEKKVDHLEKKIPKPLSALLDTLCLGALFIAAAWLMAKFGWIDRLSWRTVGIAFGSIFVLSLVYRLFGKSTKA
jgi:hypothetical protein